MRFIAWAYVRSKSNSCRRVVLISKQGSGAYNMSLHGVNTGCIFKMTTMNIDIQFLMDPQRAEVYSS